MARFTTHGTLDYSMLIPVAIGAVGYSVLVMTILYYRRHPCPQTMVA